MVHSPRQLKRDFANLPLFHFLAPFSLFLLSVRFLVLEILVCCASMERQGTKSVDNVCARYIHVHIVCRRVHCLVLAQPVCCVGNLELHVGLDAQCSMLT